MKFIDERLHESFFARVDRNGPLHIQLGTQCWLWTGGLNDSGYGTCYTRSKPNKRAHHVSWEMVYGPVPAGLILRHKCDVRRCVNPQHLETGTKADNSKDMVMRGRSAYGERHSQAVLSDVEVALIRDMARQGHRQRDLVKLFDSTSATISRIVCMRTRC